MLSGKVKLTPNPTTANEVRYLYNNFSKLGIIESFHIKRDFATQRYGDQIDLQLNVSSSRLNPFEKFQSEPEAMVQNLKIRTREYLRKIIAIPRYQYVYNDTSYLQGGTRIPFKHRLIGDGLKVKDYTISDSTIENPFCTIELQNEKDIYLRYNMLFNMEKFTQLEFKF